MKPLEGFLADFSPFLAQKDRKKFIEDIAAQVTSK
jgi:hypothetical protein